MQELTIKYKVPTADVIDLRHRVLRAGLPIESAHFEGDDDSDTHHMTAYVTDVGQPIACVSYMLNEYSGKPAWQLRGMATDPSYRNQRIGGFLLRSSEQYLVGQVLYDHVKMMWCNARENAAYFYRSNGWIIVSDVFEIPTAGRHYKMIRKL